MERLVREIGPLGGEARRRGRPEAAYGAYGSLVRSMVGQQISTAAARSIYARLLALFEDRPPSPEDFLRADEDALRSAGLSRSKIAYLRDLALHARAGELETLHQLSDDEVSARLTAIKGIGQWTADMFLIFHLERPDVLPVGDLGVRRAAERAYGLPELPTPTALRKLAEPWRPERTLASLYLWESLSATPMGG